MRPKGKRMLAWLLATTVTLSGNSFTVLADELDFTDVQEVHEEETTEEQAAQDENATAEIQIQDDFQSEEIEEPVVEEAEEPQIEETEESEITAEEVDEEIQEEPLFSAGEEENNQDPEEYKIWFENLRDDEYSTYFFDNENGELRLNTENLNGKNASISWEVGSRTNDPGGLGNDEFTTDTGLPEEMIFWSENAENNSVLEIDGAKLQEAIRWLNDNKGDEYWFEVRAYVNTEGNDEPVYQEQAGLYSREHVEDYHLPDDEVLLTDWNYWVGRYNYSCYVENEEYLNGGDIALELTDVSVVNAPEEEDETPVCEIELANEDGWNIRAKRFGTAIVTLIYKDISGEEQQHSFRIYVDGHKFTLEPQWPASGNNMLKNSEMTISFVLHHDWKNSDEDQGSEDMTGWTLELDSDEDGYAYDTKLLDVEVHGEEHTITIRSKDNTWGTGIALRALHPSEDESEETTYSYVNIPVQVCEEYDVLYPESIENIQAGDVLDFNTCDLKVERIKENEESYIRDDVTYDFEYDTNQWTDEAADGQLPILRRKTADGTWVNVIARDGDGNEIGRREYWFDDLDYSIWFENLRDGDYSTYFFSDENGELKLNTENLNDRETYISWEVGYRTDDQDGGDDKFTSDMELPEEMIFWSETDDNSILEINGQKLWNANRWLGENVGGNFWFEARASVKVREETVYMAQAGINTRETREDYYLPEDEVILMDDDYWINRNYDGYIQNQEDPDGRNFNFTVTDVTVSNAEHEEDETPVCEVNYQDENGWNIQAKRFGTAVVTLTYNNISGEKQQHSFKLYVNSDKFTLEPQWTASGSCMLRNSEMKIPFVLYHEWKCSDEDQGSEEVKDWNLEFALDENGWKYDTNLLENVAINGHEITISSGEGDWGTDIFLKAMIPSENGKQEDVTYNNVHIEVCREYDVLYPESVENINVNEILDLNRCGLKVEHIRENAPSYTREDVSYDFEYDTNQWTNEASEDKFPILRRNTTNGTSVNVIARDKDGNEICRREYWFDGLDYSVWFENMRQDEYSTYFFEDETGELRLNTENLKDKKNVSVEWEVGYRTEEDENGNDHFMQLPTDQTFWSEKKGDISTLVIDGRKLRQANNWMEENDKGNYWIEVRAYVKINGTEEVFTVSAGLFSKENIEQYQLGFGGTFENVSGNVSWVDKDVRCYVENKEYPYGTTLLASITKIKTLDKKICSVSYLQNGWLLRYENPGETRLEVTYTDIHGKQQNSFFNISVQNVLYWYGYISSDGSDQILPNGEKQYQIYVYRWEAEHLEEDIEIDPSEYELELPEDAYDSNLVESVRIDGNKVILKVKDIQDQEVSVNLVVHSKQKDENGEPFWSAENDIYAYAIQKYSDELKLSKGISIRAEVGETLDLNEYQPVVLRYDAEAQEWKEIQDNDNIRIRLEYDENIWKATDTEKEIPVLTRINGERTNIRLIAEEMHIDRYGAEVWEPITEASYYFETTYDRNGQCSHIWETVTDSKATCDKAGKQHKECTACQEKKDYTSIPALGHSWGKYVVTKKATVFAQGQETRTCGRCKKKETRKTAKLKAALNLSAYSFPLQRGKTVTIKTSGLRTGDYVKLVSSSKSSVLKAVKLKNGDIRLTAQRNTSKKAVTVKVLVKTAGGAGRTITVTVQSGKVATKKITGVPRSFTIKQGKTTVLKPVRSPFTSQYGITYTSSNKKIVTVDSKGRVKGIRPGSAVITVRSGSVSVRCTVKVVK